MGMQMRLGFSIAAFLEPDVLLVDEVLSVGDANFQQKCLKRIGEIVRSGTTLLYVSHDLASVEASCEQAVWLADAVVQASGPTKEVVAKYRAAVEQNAALVTSTEGVVQVLKAEIEAADGGQIRSECDLDVRLTLNSPEASRRQLLHRRLPGHAPSPCSSSATAGRSRRVTSRSPAACTTSRCPRVGTRCGRPCPAMPAGKGKPLLPWRPVMSFDADGPRAVEPARGRHGRSRRSTWAPTGRSADPGPGHVVGPRRGQGKKTRSLSDPARRPVRMPAARAQSDAAAAGPGERGDSRTSHSHDLAAPPRFRRAPAAPVPAVEGGPAAAVGGRLLEDLPESGALPLGHHRAELDHEAEALELQAPAQVDVLADEQLLGETRPPPRRPIGARRGWRPGRPGGMPSWRMEAGLGGGATAVR